MVDILVSRALAVGSGVVLAGTALSLRHRERPSATTFAALVGTLAVTALCMGVTAHTGLPYKVIWLVTSLAVPVALALFAFDYYGVDLLATRTRMAAGATPAALGAVGGIALILGTPAMSPGTATPAPTLGALPAWVFDIAGTLNAGAFYYTTALMILAVGLVGRTVLRYEHLDVRLGPVVAFIGVWPWLAYLGMPRLAAVFTREVGIFAVAVGYAGSAAAATLATGPLGLFESSPVAGTVGPDVVLDSMEDVVVVVDDGGTVLRVNEMACETFDTTATAAVGAPVTALVGRPAAALADEESVTLETARGAREFAVTASPVTDRTGGERGRALVLRDVTRRQTREQRLSVLNRVLRHNLRNDAASIMSRAELLSDGGDPEQAERILDTTTELVDIAERAREIEGMMTVGRPSEPVDLAPVVERVADDVEATHPAVEVTTALPDDARATLSPAVFETVLANLIENAAEHNDADQPIVVVSVDQDEDGLAVSVADNGPGLPDHERSVLEGGEDQLDHGSGLGLWAVNWGVTRMGGELAFSANEPRGTVATVELPHERAGVTAGAD